jgi:hypothetical protein
MQYDGILTDVRTAVVALVVGFIAGRSPEIFKAVRSGARNYYGNWQNTKARKFAERALNNPNFYRFLVWYHNVSLYEHEGTFYPAVVFPVSDLQEQENPRAVLCSWPPQTTYITRDNEDFVSFDEKFLSRTKRSGKVTNRQTFCAQRLEVKKETAPVIHGGLVGYYEDCLATSDALEHELLTAFGKHLPEPQHFKDFVARLPQREALMRFCRERGLNPIFDGAGRSAAIAVATLTVAYRKEDNEFVTFFGPRSGKTAVHAHLLHVAPSGMFQPSKDWPKDVMDGRYAEEWNLRHHVYRELPEELFDIDAEKTEGETPRRFYKILEVDELDQMLDSKQGARLFVTAVMINLLNLRPEICTLLIISNPEWYELHDRAQAGRHPFKRNWEFVSEEELREDQLTQAKGHLFWRKPITRGGKVMTDSELLKSIGDASASGFVVPGAVALWLGLDLFRAKLPQLQI